MAGDWIKMRSNLDTSPRVIELAGVLKLPELYVVGLLWKVWSWADTHTLDGNAIRVTDVTLDRLTGVTGFASALRNVGWLEGEDGSISFPRFTEHNGKTAKNRAETAVRVAKHRNAKPVTSVTQKTLPEKRREEKNTTTPTPSNRNDLPEVLSGLPEEWQQGQIGNLLCLWSNHIAAATGKPHDAISMKAMVYQFQQKGWSVQMAIAALKYSLANPHWKQVSHPTEHKKGEQSSYQVLG
jgi:hypothetical protein